MPTNNADLCSVHAALAVEERQLFRPTLRDVAIVRIQAVDKLLQLKLADVWSKRSHQGNRMTTKPAATRTSSEHVIPAPPPAPPVFCRCVIFDTTFWYSFVRSLNRVRGMSTTAPPPDCVGLHTNAVVGRENAAGKGCVAAKPFAFVREGRSSCFCLTSAHIVTLIICLRGLEMSTHCEVA